MSRTVYSSLPVFGQNLACSLAGWVRARRRFTPHFHAALEAFERTADASADELRALQRTRLDALVERARRATKPHRDSPAPSTASDPEVAIAETLASLPIMEKESYRADPDSYAFTDVPRSKLRVAHTSGTTGSPARIAYLDETLAEEYAIVWRMRRRSGAGLGDPYVSFNGQPIVPVDQRRPPYWRTNWYASQKLFSAYHMSPENLDAYIAELHRTRAKYIMGYPSGMHLVATRMVETGRCLPQGRLTAIYPSSESLLAFQREDIATGFGAPVWDRYGAGEFAVSMTSCELGRLHVDMEFCIVEVDVREENDEIERGPLLVTSLATHATAFIRYRIGDVGTRLKRPCECGRQGDVFVDVDGRIEDYIRTPDGRLVGRLDHVFKGLSAIREAQIVQREFDSVEVLVSPDDTFDEAVSAKIVERLRERIGSDVSISVELRERIPRDANGKFRAVCSELGPIAPPAAGGD